MKLLTAALKAKLNRNAVLSQQHADEDKLFDPHPVVKFFNPVGPATWLISELDEDNIAFGLCDLGMGCPELGYVCLTEMSELRLRFGLRIERDLHFKATKKLSEYADEARAAGGIRA